MSFMPVLAASMLATGTPDRRINVTSAVMARRTKSRHVDVYCYCDLRTGFSLVAVRTGLPSEDCQQ